MCARPLPGRHSQAGYEHMLRPFPADCQGRVEVAIRRDPEIELIKYVALFFFLLVCAFFLFSKCSAVYT